MRRSARWIAVLAVVGIVAAACGGNGGDEPTSSATADGGDIPTGGTVRIAVSSEPASAAFDPAKEYYQLSFEILKCCLARTLYATNGKPVDEGGAELRPDIAADLPTVSEDQLTWTFPIKQGVMYSPPFEDVEVTARTSSARSSEGPTRRRAPTATASTTRPSKGSTTSARATPIRSRA